MSLLTRRNVILAKTESSYSVDPTPTGTANAMLVKNLSVQPFQADLVQRDVIRDFLGNSDTLVAAKWATASFEIEFAGSGSAGLAPGYDPLLKACGFSPATTSISISSLSQSAGLATAVTATAHGLTSGDVVTISGASQSGYNKSATVTVVDATTFTYAVVGGTVSPATGAPILNTATVYSPISTSIGSVTLYFYNDGVLHKLTGCRGTFEIDLAAKQIPAFKFTFTGLYNAPADTSLPTTDYSAFQIPKVANTSNTPAFSLFGFSGALLSMNLNLANDVKYRTLIGEEEVKIVDRKPSGSMVVEAPLTATKDFFTIASSGITGAFSLTHGTVGGGKVLLAAPRVSIGNPQYQDSDGVQMLSIPFTPSPSTGNDELTITVK